MDFLDMISDHFDVQRFALNQKDKINLFRGLLNPVQTDANIVGCYMLRPFAHPVACCWMLLRVVAQSLKPVKLFSQQLPTFLLFRDRQSVAQQCWIRLHNSSNIVEAARALRIVYKDLWVVSFPRRTAGPNIVGNCCIHLHTTANTHAALESTTETPALTL